ncbi:MAG: thioredoxin family protein [Candidatus Peribacteraceae bacterium]|jgi:peroxiredoxin
MSLVQDNSRVLGIGDLLPPFTLPATDGMTVESGLIKDMVLVVIFMCNHCPYAKAYEDRLIAIAEHFDEEGVQFILVNSNDPTDYPEDSFAAMRERALEKGYPFPYCVDKSQQVARSFGALCTPHCFVFDHERRLRYKGRVDDNWKEPENVSDHTLRDAIAALLKGEEPEVAEANAIGCSIKWRPGNEPKPIME